MTESEHHWGTSTKRTVVVVILVLLALVLYRFRAVIPPLVIAFLIHVAGAGYLSMKRWGWIKRRKTS